MKKAVLSNRIYLDYNEELLKIMREELTYKIKLGWSANGIMEEYIQTYNRINAKVASIPSGRLDLIPEDYEIIDKRVFEEVDWPETNVTLRESQQLIYDKIQDSCIVNAPVSWGKTFTALCIAKKLKQNTLVVVHTGILLDQWVEEAKKVLGVTPSIINGTFKHYEGEFLTIGMCQSVTKVINNLAENYGTLILDECHHSPANTFKNIIDKCKARYKIGLSGTLERKDGKHVLFTDYFGPIRYKPPAENYMEPEVLIIKTNIKFEGAMYQLAVTDLSENDEFIHLLVETALHLANQGHSVLVVSERVHTLKRCHKLTEGVSCIVIGGTSREDREEAHRQIMSGEKRILWGSVNIYSEGVSLNKLSCLILGAISNNVPQLTQLIGRVTRVYPDKPKPLIVDINLGGTTVRKGIVTRTGHYANCGYKISTIRKTY